MKGTKRLNLSLALVVLSLVALDQLAKALVRNSIISGGSGASIRFLELVNFANTGSVFGLFKGSSGFLIALAIVAAAVISFTYRNLSKVQRFGAALIISGVAGNTIDRLSQGYVTDFIHVAPFPAFNFADAFLFIGACIILYDVAKGGLSGKKSKKR